MTTHDRTRHQATRRAARGDGAWAAAALAVGLVVAGAPSASAHDRLVRSDPASGAVLEAVPEEAVLTFSSAVLEVGTVVELQDDAGETVADAMTSVAGADVVLPLPRDLESGDYTLAYRVTSSDGHPLSGEVAFTLDGAAASPTTQPTPSSTSADGPAGAGSSSSAGGGPPSSGSAADVGDDAEAAASSSQDPGLPWTPVVVVLVVVVLGGAAATLLGRRRDGARAR